MSSMRDFMRVGLIHFMAFPQVGGGEGPILETLRRIALDDYFDAVEITRIKDAGVRAQARDLLAGSHLTVAYGAHPIILGGKLNLNAVAEDERLNAVAIMKTAIDEAYEVGASGFAFLSGRYEEASKETALGQLVKSTVELCQYAKARGNMPVVLEVFDYDIDKCSLIGPAPLAARYAREVRATCDNFGLLVDASHVPIIHESFAEAVLPVKEYLVHAHLGNCVLDPAMPGYGDQHPRFGCPGGVNDVDELCEFLRVLLEVGFLNPVTRPIVSFEVKPLAGEDPEVVIVNAKRTLNAAWAQLENTLDMNKAKGLLA